MDPSHYPFGMVSDSRSASEPNYNFDPFSYQSGSRVQSVHNDAGPSYVFHGAAMARSIESDQHRPEVQATHQEQVNMMDVDNLVGQSSIAEGPARLPDMSAPVSRRSRNVQLDWPAHKDHIQRLYFENKTLKEIREIMLTEYSFIAT